MPEPLPVRTLTVGDPRALRALAHPVRLALVGLLRRRGPLTATQASAELGESVAGCSFHLRQLAKYGLVEPAPRGRGREKPWRATAEFTSWPSGGDDPELAAASDQLSAVLVRRYAGLMLDALTGVRSLPGEWAAAMLAGDTMLYLTARELAELRDQVTGLARSRLERTRDPALRPPGARLVHFIHFAVPVE